MVDLVKYSLMAGRDIMIDMILVLRGGVLLLLAHCSYDDIKTRNVTHQQLLCGVIMIVGDVLLELLVNGHNVILYHLASLVAATALGYLGWKYLKYGAGDAKLIGIVGGALGFIPFITLFLVMMLPVILFYEYLGHKVWKRPLPFVPGIAFAYLCTLLHMWSGVTL